MQDVITIKGEKHVILDGDGGLFNPKFVARSLVTGEIHNVKLTRKGLVRYNLVQFLTSIKLIVVAYLVMIALYILK